jgi:hypothetical protein
MKRCKQTKSRHLTKQLEYKASRKDARRSKQSVTSDKETMNTITIETYLAGVHRTDPLDHTT